MGGGGMDRERRTTKDAAHRSAEKVVLGIQGMTCATCAGRVERGLAELPGVAAANVNLAMETASVTFDPMQVTVEQVSAKVRDLGYGIARDKVRLELVGMTCANCASRIERGLNSLPGVKAAVNLGTESAQVEYTPSLAGGADPKQEVAERGIQAYVTPERARGAEQ